MTGMRSVVIVDGFPEEVGRNVDAREDDTDELFVGDCAPMIRIHHAEHGPSLGGPYVFHARPLRHVFQKARELLLVEGTRAVFVDAVEGTSQPRLRGTMASATQGSGDTQPSCLDAASFSPYTATMCFDPCMSTRAHGGICKTTADAVCIDLLY